MHPGGAIVIKAVILSRPHFALYGLATVSLCLSYAYMRCSNGCIMSAVFLDIVNVTHFSRSTVTVYTCTQLGLILEAEHCDAEDET